MRTRVVVIRKPSDRIAIDHKRFCLEKKKPNFGKSNDFGCSQTNFEGDVPALPGHGRTSQRAGVVGNEG